MTLTLNPNECNQGYLPLRPHSYIDKYKQDFMMSGGQGITKWSILATSGRNFTYLIVLRMQNKHRVTTRENCHVVNCISLWILNESVLETICSKLKSCRTFIPFHLYLAAVVLQLVTIECCFWIKFGGGNCLRGCPLPPLWRKPAFTFLMHVFLPS